MTSDSVGAGEEQLLRPQLHLHDAVATGLAAILGAGIFAVVGPAAGIAGPALLVSLLIAATVAFFNAMSSTQLARVFPRTGGSYHFGREMLGPWWGFMAGWMFLLANTLGPGVIAIAFGVTVINASGIKRSVRVTDVMVLLSVLSLVAVVVLGLGHGDAAHFTPFAPHGAIGVLRATGLLFFAYTGYSRIATLVEEVHNPERVIPIATTVALGGAAILYVLVATTALAVLGAGPLSQSSSPLRTTLVVAGVAAGPAIVVGGALVTTFNEALSDLLGVSRVAFAMARGGDLPHVLSRIDANQNPWASVLFVGIVSIMVAGLAPFTAAVMVSSFGILAYYLIANLSAFRLKPKDRMFPRWLAVAGFAGCLALIATLAPPEILIGLAAAAVGVPYRWIWLRLAGER